MRVGSLVKIKECYIEGTWLSLNEKVGIVTSIQDPVITNPIMWVTVRFNNRVEEFSSRCLEIVSE